METLRQRSFHWEVHQFHVPWSMWYVSTASKKRYKKLSAFAFDTSYYRESKLFSQAGGALWQDTNTHRDTAPTPLTWLHERSRGPSKDFKRKKTDVSKSSMKICSRSKPATDNESAWGKKNKSFVGSRTPRPRKNYYLVFSSRCKNRKR